jgi:hypothetical protein
MKQSFSFGDPRAILMMALASRISVARTTSNSVFILASPVIEIRGGEGGYGAASTHAAIAARKRRSQPRVMSCQARPPASSSATWPKSARAQTVSDCQ